ncbi:hypothetical protein CASFOL_029842 [Castilleja foliolosa]|uniref:SMP domain-containing protein n=1 Tax=Castilleja foliolosa TaxID=1961234 RepID=A0ABD3C8Y7_9LAMI
MSQQQPIRQHVAEEQQQEPIKYGDLFQVSGELSDKPVAPVDASMMQSAETTLLGQTQKGGPAAVMQAAATRNERAGLVGHHDVTDFADEGVTVEELDLPGNRVIAETVAGQVVGRSVQAKLMETATQVRQTKITIGEALEASARKAGDKPVDHSDAAAITAAEHRATGSNIISPGGLAATAQSAAAFNDGLIGDQGKVKLADILKGARDKLAVDKIAKLEDAEGIMAASLTDDPNMKVHPGGVAAAVMEAVRMNVRGSI